MIFKRMYFSLVSLDTQLPTIKIFLHRASRQTIQNSDFHYLVSGAADEEEFAVHVEPAELAEQLRSVALQTIQLLPDSLPLKSSRVF